MKSNALIMLALILVLIPMASATCMTAEDMLNIISIENQLNITDNQLVRILDSMCASLESRMNTTYSQETLDAKFAGVDLMLGTLEANVNTRMDSVNATIQNEMQPYLDYFEDTYGYNDLLSAIYNNTLYMANRTDTYYMQNSTLNESMFITKVEWDEINPEQMRIDINNLQAGTGGTGMMVGASAQQQNLFNLLIYVIVAAVALFILHQFGILKRLGIGIPKIPSITQPIQQFRQAVPSSMPMGDPYGTPAYANTLMGGVNTPIDTQTEVRKAREKRLLESVKRAREVALREDAERAGAIRDPKKRAAEMERISKEIEELAQEA